MLDHKKKLAVVAGRSGGHIIPALTIAQQHNAHALFFSTDTALDQTILKDHALHYVPLTLPNIPRNPLKLIVFGFQFMRAFFKSIYELYRFKPQELISTGGYIALPVCIAAYCLRIPITLYELNAIPGKATSWLAPLATTIHICFENSAHYLPKKKCVLSAYPLRFAAHAHNEQHTIAPSLGFSPEKKTILILGGSQGSLFINERFKLALESNSSLRSSIQVIHQTGGQDQTDWTSLYTQHKIPAIVFDFQNDITPYYRAADLIICRSGAGTLFEAMFFRKPCITIPLETQTTDHQIDNARAMAKQYPHLVTIMYQKDVSLSISTLIQTIIVLLGRKQLQ